MNCINFVVPMNPCSCGYFPDRSRCTCSKSMIERHLSKISRPLLDRMDICVEVSRPALHELTARQPEESSAQIRNRVEQAQRIQQERFSGSGILYNSQIPPSAMEQWCVMEKEGAEILHETFEKMEMTARGYYRALRVARTIADMEGAPEIGRAHICESLLYRSLDRKVWDWE